VGSEMCIRDSYEAELQRLLHQGQAPSQPKVERIRSFLGISLVLMVVPYLLAMLAILALGYLLVWAMKTLW